MAASRSAAKKVTSPALNVLPRGPDHGGRQADPRRGSAIVALSQAGGPSLTSHRDPEGRPTGSRMRRSLPRAISVGRLTSIRKALLLLNHDGELARTLETSAQVG